MHTTIYSNPSILQPSILRPPLIIRPLDLVPKGNLLCTVNDLYFKTTCNIRPHFLGPMGGLKIKGPLYLQSCTCTGIWYLSLVSLVLHTHIHITQCITVARQWSLHLPQSQSVRHCYLELNVINCMNCLKMVVQSMIIGLKTI